MTKKKFITIIVSVLIVGLIISVFKPANKSNDKLVKVTRGTIIEKALAVGSITPLHSISVTSSFPGTVFKLAHDEGDFVKKGDVLLEIKPNPTPSDLDTAKRTLDEKLAVEKNAEEHLNRVQALLKQSYVTHDEFDQATQDFQSAKIQRQLAQEQLAILQKGKAVVAGQTIQSVIVSPIDGYILSREVDIGDTVVPQTNYQAGKTLFTIANMHDLIFKGQVNEIDVGKLKVGMPANLTLSALPDMPIKGVLNKIALESAQLEEATNSDNTNAASSNNANNAPFNVGFNVIINQLSIPPNIQLRAGYSANGEIIIRRATNILMLPERVVDFKEGKSYVWLQGKKPQQHEIKTGLSDGINIEIIGGLKENEQVLDNVTSDKADDNS